MATRQVGGYRLIAMVIAAALWATGCAERVDPGYTGIKVNYYGGSRGVDDVPIVTGMVWYNPVTTSVLEYPIFTRTTTWTRDESDAHGNEEISFNTREGSVITADISLSYNLVEKHVPAFYVKFRSEDLDDFTHGLLRNVARDAFNEIGPNYSVEEAYADKKHEMLEKVRARVNQQVNPYGVHIEQFGIIGAPRLPENVVQAINAKIKATQDAQRVENELRQARAEVEKEVAKAEGAAKSAIARAQGEAEANRLLTESLSDRVIEWQRLQTFNHQISKWNGALPSVSGGNSPFIYQLPQR